MLEKIKRLAFLPVLVSNLYSIIGVLFLHWSVADIFFWFWCEFVLAGITTFVLLFFWRNRDKTANRNIATLAIYGFGFSFLYLLIFATMFAGMAYRGEWKSYDRLPQFIANKEIGLAAIAISYLFILVKMGSKQNYGPEDSKQIGMLFNKKAFVIVGFYVLFLVHGWISEWITGARSINLSSAYLRGMGATLLCLKLLVELGIFDRLLKPRKEQSKLL
jgi:hypothetical protein